MRTVPHWVRNRFSKALRCNQTMYVAVNATSIKLSDSKVNILWISGAYESRKRLNTTRITSLTDAPAQKSFSIR
jgi:hypothetical protein